MFWKIFDKVGTAAFWILGPIAGLVILVVWLFQPSEADYKAALEDVERSEQVYNMAMLNYAERELNGISSNPPTPCEIYHKVVYYVDKGIFDRETFTGADAMYDFRAYSCGQTEAPKKYRIKKKEKNEQPKKSKNKNAILSEDEVVVVLGDLVKTFGLSGSEIDKLKKKLASCTTAECLEDITTELQSKSPSITQEPMTEEERNIAKAEASVKRAREKWGATTPQQVYPILSQDEINVILTELENKYETNYTDLNKLRVRLEKCTYADCVDSAIADFRLGLKPKQQVVQQPVVNEPVVQDKGEFIEVPKAIDVEPEPEMVKTQQEDTPIRKGDCGDPTFLKYTQMYDNGVMGRIEYQDFVYSNGFDKCF